MNDLRPRAMRVLPEMTREIAPSIARDIYAVVARDERTGPAFTATVSILSLRFNDESEA